MTAENRDLPRGIKTEENVEADHLERTLGVTFPNKPHKVFLGFRNRFVLYRHSRDAVNDQIKTLTDVLRGSPMHKAWYEPRYHAFFYEKGRGGKEVQDIINVQTIYHENLHSYNHGINPDLVERLIQVSDRNTLIKNISYKALDEGMAEWGSWETVALDADRDVFNDPDASYRLHRKTLTERATILLVPLTEEAIEEKDLIERSKAVLYGIVDDQSTFSISSLEMIYRIGHYFVNEAIHELRKMNFKRQLAMVFVLLNPPQTIEDLVNPREYIHKLTTVPPSASDTLG